MDLRAHHISGLLHLAVGFQRLARSAKDYEASYRGTGESHRQEAHHEIHVLIACTLHGLSGVAHVTMNEPPVHDADHSTKCRVPSSDEKVCAMRAG